LAECVLDTQRDNDGAPFPICLVGHAGDGNFHLLYVLDPSNAAELEQARGLNDRLVARALALGGTCTGEHGVGLGKMKFLEAEHGPAAVSVMRDIKRALDPENRMNPGKIVE
jgi:D-lactate dehydrogenase (cytochrome)